MTDTPHTARPRQRSAIAPTLLLGAALVALPVLLWQATGNPITTTTANLSGGQAQLLWNTLVNDPKDAAPCLGFAAADIVWLLWLAVALPTTLYLAVIAFRLPATWIPRALLRLTPVTVIDGVVLGAAAAAAQAHTIPAHTATAETGPLEHAYATALAEHDARCAGGGQGAATVVVQPGDTLWGIAKATYGHGQDWPSIYAANHAQPQPDGHSLENPETIDPSWRLTIPKRPAPAHPAWPHTRHDTAPTGDESRAVTPPPTIADTPAPRAAAFPGPRAALTAHSARTVPAAAHGHPDRHSAHRPGDADARRVAPSTTGIDLPGATYIGITLAAAVAASTIALRRSGRPSLLPVVARRLAVLHHRANLAAVDAWDPDLEDDPAIPPLLKPHPGELVFGTAPSGTDEVVLDPKLHTLTLYTGPGAEPAAAALALSALSSTPPHRLITTTKLATALLGIGADDAGEPAWLTLTLNTTDALKAATEHTPTAHGSLLIADAAEVSTLHLSRALAADHDQRLTILLLGEAPHLPELARTRVEIGTDGAVRSASGKLAAAFAHTRVHHVPPETAAELYQVLRHARAATHPTTERPAHADPADEDDHPAPTALPEASPNPPASDDLPPATAPSPTPLLLRILGPVTVENPDTGTSLERPFTGRTAELLTYLAAHPKGRTLSQIVNAIWAGESEGGAKSGIVRVRKELRQAITTLAPDLQPDPTHQVDPVPQTNYGAYHLDPSLITTDLAAFLRLANAATQTTDPNAAQEFATHAAALNRGPAAESIPDEDLPWLTDLRSDLARRAAKLATLPSAALADRRTSHGTTPARPAIA